MIFFEFVSLPVSDKDLNTVGGFVFHLFGRLPARGESISYDHYVFRVEKMGRARILRVRIEREEGLEIG